MEAKAGSASVQMTSYEALRPGTVGEGKGMMEDAIVATQKAEAAHKNDNNDNCEGEEGNGSDGSEGREPTDDFHRNNSYNGDRGIEAVVDNVLDTQVAQATTTFFNEPEGLEPAANDDIIADADVADDTVSHAPITNGAIVLYAQRDRHPAWMARRMANQRDSPIYRLCDELLLMIMDALDETDRWLVRSACHMFLRIVATYDAQDLRGQLAWDTYLKFDPVLVTLVSSIQRPTWPRLWTKTQLDLRYDPMRAGDWARNTRFWSVWPPRYEPVPEDMLLVTPDVWCDALPTLDLVEVACHRGNWYCDNCRASPQPQPLVGRSPIPLSLHANYCGLCLIHMPNIYFAADQRGIIWKEGAHLTHRARCRAHEGLRARLCEHKLVNMPDRRLVAGMLEIPRSFQAAGGSISGGRSDAYILTRCTHPSHRNDQGPPPQQQVSPPDAPPEEPNTATTTTRTRIRALWHAVKGRMRQVLSQGMQKVIKVTRKSPTHAAVEDVSSIPTMVLDRLKQHVEMHWSGYMFDLDPSVPVTREQLRAHLAAIPPERVQLMGICMHVGRNLGDGQLALPFEDGRCACFDDATDDDEPDSAENSRTAETLLSGYRDSIILHGHTKSSSQCCRCLDDEAKLQRREARRVAAENGSSGPRIRDYDDDGHHVGIFMGRSTSNTSHYLTCGLCDSTYTWERRGTAMHLRARRVVNMGMQSQFGYCLQWMRQSIIEDWHLEDDPDFDGMYLCPDSNCATSDRYASLFRYAIPHRSRVQRA